jgi:hypothetical protein
MWEHFFLTDRIIGKTNFNILMTHLKADVAKFVATLAFKWVIKILKFVFLLFCL